jgi:UDP-2-acetamido-3-amino-2,3-dideoxy-glucuronate N-acetyltransferase
MTFTNILYPRSEYPQRGSDFYMKTLVKHSATIGANATIICGVTIGRYSLIGAGAVITKNVPDFALVVGNPGKIVGWVDKKGLRLNLNKNGKSKCGKYKLKNNRLSFMS